MEARRTEATGYGRSGSAAGSSRFKVASSLLLLVLGLSPLACGAASEPKPEAPDNSKSPHDGQEMPASDALATFEQAERQLQSDLLGYRSDAPAPQPASPPQPSSAPPAQPYPQPTPPPGYPADHDGATFRSAASRCERACRALASMTRAAERLCELDGDDTNRCRNVRERVAAARELVTATCADCSR